MNLIFRDYKEEDKQTLFDLIKKLGKFAQSLDSLQRVKNLPGFFEISLKETLENVEKYQGKIWFAEEEGKIVGYIIGANWTQSEMNKLEIGPHTLGEVVDLFIEEDYRRQGIGTKMLQMMEDYFKEKGCDSMWVQVFAPNEKAHNTYKKFGFIDREIGMLKQL